MTNKKTAILNESNYWWLQRLFSIILIPLFIWFSIALISFVTSSPSEGITLASVFQYIGLSTSSTKYIFIIFSIITFLHVSLGIEEIIDDYVHSEKAKLVASILVKILIIRLMNEVYIFYIG